MPIVIILVILAYKLGYRAGRRSVLRFIEDGIRQVESMYEEDTDGE